MTNQDAEHLRYLERLGLRPGAAVMVKARAPFDGPISVTIGADVRVLDSRMARAILVDAESVDTPVVV